jgi:hypothetical protein
MGGIGLAAEGLWVFVSYIVRARRAIGHPIPIFPRGTAKRIFASLFGAWGEYGNQDRN